MKHQLSPADLPDISHSHPRQKAIVGRKRKRADQDNAGSPASVSAWCWSRKPARVPAAIAQPCPAETGKARRSTLKGGKQSWNSGHAAPSSAKRQTAPTAVISKKHTARFQGRKPSWLWGSDSSRHSSQTSASLLCTFTLYHQCLFLESVSQLLTA